MKSAEEFGRETFERLAAQTAAKRAEGATLRAEISAAMEAYTGSRRLTAKRVIAMLTRTPLPSVRTVQEHLRAIRADGR